MGGGCTAVGNRILNVPPLFGGLHVAHKVHSSEDAFLDGKVFVLPLGFRFRLGFGSRFTVCLFNGVLGSGCLLLCSRDRRLFRSRAYL